MHVSWRRWSRILGVIVLLGVVCAVPAVRRAMLRTLGWALVVDEPVGPADVIVVPVWAGVAGAIDAADLVHGRIAGRIAVLAGPPNAAEPELTRRGVAYQNETAALAQLLRSLGILNVEVIPDPADGTDEETHVLLSWCEQRHFQSIVVVSPPDHSRRVRRALHRALRGHPTTVAVRSARYSSFDPERWWTTRSGVRIEIVELQKLLLDVVRHPIS
jgi:hypothetical protein